MQWVTSKEIVLDQLDLRTFEVRMLDLLWNQKLKF